MKVLLLLLLVVGAIGLSVRAAIQQKNVNVELRAKWTGTPLLLELSEILAKERPDLFWKFTESWLEAEPSITADTSEGCLREIVSRGKSLVDEPLASVLELSLLARSSSPKLVLYRQLARESLVVHSVLTPNKDVDRWAVSENPGPPEGKCCWVDVGSRLFLDEEAILNWVKTPGRSPDVDDADILDLDHVYPFSGAPKDVAILYGALGTLCFQKYHTILREAAKEGRLKYVLRPVLPSGCEASTCARIGTEKAVKLAGYGVELALKNMEYKAIDDTEVSTAETKDDAKADDPMQEVRGFIFSQLLERKPHLTAELMTFRDHLLSSDISESMNVWELKDLGYQAAQRIVGASEPLRLMQELNQNFPSLVSSLSRMKLNDTIKEEIVTNQQTVTPGRTLLGINGALVNPENLDLFSLIDIVQGELSFADKLVKMKVPSDAISKLLKLPEAAEKTTFRLDFRSKEFVHFLNDIETDAKYRRWRPNLNELLMPLFPGQMRYIRKNLYHAVYVIDPASMSGLKMVGTMLLYYENNLPMRFGLTFLSPKLMKLVESGDVIDHVADDDLSSLVIRLFLYIRDHDSLHAAFEFLNSIIADSEDVLEDGVVEEARIEEAFLEFLSGMPKTKSMDLFEMLKQGQEYKEDPLKTTQFVFKLGLSQMYPSVLVNGRVYGPSQVQSALMMAMNEELQHLQEAVYFGQIDSRTDVLDKLLSDEGCSRYNPKIVGSDKDAKCIGLAVPVTGNHPVVSRLQYLHSPGTEDDVKPVTHWVIVDLTRKSGVQLLGQGLQYLMQGSSRGRLAVLHNIENEGALVEGSTELLLRVVNLLIRSPSSRAKSLAVLHKVLSTYSNLGFEEAFQSFLDLAAANDLDVKKLKTSLLESAAGTIEDHFQDRSLVSSLFGLKPGSMAIVTNGRVVVQEEQHLIAEDFSLLEQLEYRRRKDLKEVIEQVSWDVLQPDEVTSDFFSTVLMVASSAMCSRVRSSDTANFHLLQAEHSAIVRQAENSFLQIDAVMNPLSSVAQRITPLLLLLDEWLQPGFRVVLNPMNSLADVPLKNFYRYVLPSKNEFRQGGSGHSARFTSMPTSRTLTMNLDVPEPWLVEPVVAVHDLDNIVLEKLGGEKTLNAVFELEALMITGHCYEHNEPPRGLQLILGTKQAPHMVDTIVMANLGYFQLKAAPGAWDLMLAAGRSSELYTLSGPKEGTDEGSLSRRVIVGDLRGQLVHLNVVKRLGKESEKLLEADSKQTRTGPNAKGGFFNWLTGGARRVDAPAKRDVTINIFSIASGHLYERFLKIMILSVLKNTDRPVKFWFIKNYLSPQFKDLIPHMAAKYNFQYELVTYKWPTFLHKQTEKQRIIWAYKILFLDVIFPLSLKKVIFVDADQIVRTDMGELYDMDIKGRPLAYTPFCDNNREMDGYRFWRQGFWQEHLQGKPYHISALYVVDLDKFRQTAAGDNLRVFYESLSRDPNSLSNLDQDLPNYAQHTVPIFSLPQEWLWCESWCGNATKDKAKTIDLCNNPMTKEPKLQGARRIVKEWPALDEEARQFSREILGNDDDQQPQQQPAVVIDSLLKDEL